MPSCEAFKLLTLFEGIDAPNNHIACFEKIRGLGPRLFHQDDTRIPI
jgi:hypothetical protein